ncbi:CCT motif -containing response regulator protein [Perilla frutescens var. hirtella]|uniref:CCT motif -containing response regulator protein n=1 Tax=Perilla frutescens var. hirtella TaxID=608512 RepID=A0AAD4P334_PERFH|nr:hypothetical protein C2S51_038941 [Perilla frutescens var. frutescens]KAH6801163.1 CCT motif -containing response regulator protein [Perilla frutescens var. hirtella]KAH6824381.1 CCT motif -containing response regulator protein [Perilla frutescens var. hirtella]
MEKGKSVIQHVDPCKMRILLCDNNAESCQEILALLRKFSYQVDAVWSATEVFETMDSRGASAHIILAEIDLLMEDDAYLLRHIMRDKRLQKIPVIILTRQDQVCVTMKGLRLGAAGYLVKPLQNEELSNLWMILQN